MTLNVCQFCQGDCCNQISINPAKGIHLPRIPFIMGKWKQFTSLKPAVEHGENHGFYFKCSWHDEETGRCKHYEKRPFICEDFICRKVLDILELVQE